MSLGLAFWILMLLWLVFGLWWNNRAAFASGNWSPVGGSLLLFLLLLLLGWASFGPPLRG